MSEEGHLPDYPTEEELRRIEEWPHTDVSGWFSFIRDCWMYSDYWNSTESEVVNYMISTGGWSGNESIITAMQNNRILWSSSWVSSRRGGHYVFSHTKPANKGNRRPYPTSRRTEEGTMVVIYQSPGNVMHGLPLSRRETGLLEAICPHGIGHPIPESTLHMDTHGPSGAKGTWGVHGCDGCCVELKNDEWDKGGEA